MTLKRTTLRAFGALLFAACAASSAFAAPPEGMVAINYSRCDGNYDSWGVHLFQRGRKGPMLVNKLDNLLNQAHAPQGDGLLNR